LKRSFDPATCAVLLLSIALNVALTFKVHHLNRLMALNQAPVVATGVHFPEMIARNLEEQPQTIRFDSTGKPSVLYVFSPTCHWCAKNLENIKKLYSLKHANFEFVGISLSPYNLQQYVSQTNFPMKVVESPAESDIKVLHLESTPETIVIDSSGTISKVWSGAYTSENSREIEHFFQIPKNSLTRVQ